MKIQDIIRALQGEMRPLDAFWALIAIAYDKGTESHLGIGELHCQNVVRSEAALKILEGAADIFLKQDQNQRYKIVEDFLDKNANDPSVGAYYWIKKDAADLFLSMVGGSENVRFSFAACFRPFFQFLMNAANEGRAISAEFLTGSDEVERNAFNLYGALNLAGNVFTSNESPLVSPYHTGANVELMLPPLGASVANTDDLPDRLIARLGVSGNRHGRINYESLCIAHSVEQKAQRTIVAVTEGALVRTVGTEATVRRELVESGCVNKVLNAPPGLIYTSTGVSLGLLVAESHAEEDTSIWMGRLPKDPFAMKDQAKDMTSPLFLGGLPGESMEDDILSLCAEARAVPVTELAANNFILAPDRYLNTGAREAISAFSSRYEMAELQDMVEMIRPANLPKSESGEYAILEAAPGDVGPRGYLQAPARELLLDRAAYHRAMQQQVRPGDVILAIKGTIGVVGIVPDAAYGEDGDEIWTAGQSLMILRPKPRSGLDPIVLYEFLSNDTVQEFISTMAGGSLIKNLGMKDLKSLLVPVPTAEQISTVHEGFIKKQEIFDEIERLTQQIEKQRAEEWPHSDLTL